MNIVAISILRPVFAWVLMFALILFGAISLNRMGVSQLPDINFPVLSISLNYEGASPELVEAELIDPIENRLLAIEGIKEIRSSARQGSASVSLEFDIDRNIDVALQEVQAALSQLRLPTGVDPAVIRKQNPEEDPILIVSVYGASQPREMLVWVENFLLDQIRFLPGVGEVSLGGFSERNLRVWLDLEKLAQRDLTVGDVVEAISSQHIESAAGQLSEGQRELRVRWMGEVNAAAEIGNIRILRRGGQINYNRDIRIRDVATIEDGLSDIRRIARVDGKQAIALQIRKQRGTNEVDVSRRVQDKLLEIKDQFPKGYSYRVNVDFTRSTKSTVALTQEKLWIAAVITILICFLFLGSLPAAMNILFSIPTSIVGTFLILYFSGFTLNIFTLLALTLSISIVVDDAIMLLENIVRHSRMNKSPAQAAYDGSIEVLPAAIAATLAVVAVFLPVVFMSGLIGKFFFQFGVTMSAAVLLSLLEAVTITPMRASTLLSQGQKMSRLEAYLDHAFENLSHRYGNWLQPLLRHSVWVVVTTFAIFAISLFSFKKVRQEFVPTQDQDLVIMTAQTPPGSSLEYTSKEAEQLEKILSSDPNIKGFFVSVGAGGPNSQVNQIFIPITLIPRSDRKLGHTDIMAQWRDKFKSLKNLKVTMRDISARNLTSGRQNPIAVSLRGGDLNILNEKAQELIGLIEKENLGVDLDTDYRQGIPELLIVPKRDAMAERGVSVEAVGEVLSAGVGGLRRGRFTAEGKRYDIRFKLKDQQVRSAEDLYRVNVRNYNGNLVPLRDIVTIQEQKASQSISRVNRQRAIAVFGNIAKGQSQATTLNRIKELAKTILPVGYSLELEGASAGFSEAFRGLIIAMLTGILVAYLILAIQFNSFLLPLSVLMALPLSLSGAFLALWIFDVSLNLFSFIGLIVLMGIAKKNSIMIVEFASQLRKSKKSSALESLVQACKIRLRPILMTSAATVAAAVPLLIGSGVGIETRVPMGLTIIGGSLISTFFTLVSVPAVYLLLAKWENLSTLDLQLTKPIETAHNKGL